MPRFAWIITLLVLMIGVGSANAQSSFWNDLVDGTFNDASKWSNGVPGAGWHAGFSGAGVNFYTVTFTNNPSNGNLRVLGGGVHFDLNGHTYSLTDAGQSMFIGAATYGGSTPGHLTIANGTLQCTNNVLIATTDEGANIDGNGYATVTTGGNWITGTNLSLGNASNVLGSLEIEHGGTVTSVSSHIGAISGSTGTVTLIGSGSTWTNDVLNVGGTSFAGGGLGTVTIGGGSILNVNTTLRIWGNGAITLNGGRLNLPSLTDISDASGVFNFISGTLNCTASNTLSSGVLTKLLGANHVLAGDRTISANIGRTLTLDSNLIVVGGTVGGSGHFVNGPGATLIISAGSVNPQGVFTNSPGGLIQVTSTGLLSPAGVFSFVALENNGEINMTSSTARIAGGRLVNNGTINGTGRIDSNLTNSASGQIQMTTGNRLVFNGTSNTNSGLISLVGGEIQFNNALTNSANTGLISGRNAILRFSGGITNNGSMAFSNNILEAGTMDIFGDITSTRFVSSADRSRITISGGSVVNFYDDVTVSPGQTDVQVSATGSTVSMAIFFGAYNGGTTGGGTAFIEGDHRPGNSPGLVAFGGDVFYGDASRLFMEIGGSSRGIQYDAIDVTGSITINGKLELSLLNGYLPSGGTTFLLINNDGIDPIQGSFDGLAEGAHFIAGGALWEITYQGGTSNDLVLTAVPEPATWTLVGLSVLGAGYYWHRHRRNMLHTLECEL